MRADRPAEDRVVVAALHPVGAGLLVRSPAAWQLVGGGDLVEHDRAVPHGRADHAIAARAQRLHEGAEPVGTHQVRVCLGSVELAHVVASCPG